MKDEQGRNVGSSPDFGRHGDGWQRTKRTNGGSRSGKHVLLILALPGVDGDTVIPIIQKLIR